jgi:hypothetical protein
MAQEAAWELVESAWAVMETLALVIPLKNRLYCNHLP